MKIGISFNPYNNEYARFGNEKFAKIAQHGFSAVDYNMADTDIEIYKLNDSELKKKMLEEKAAADLANIEISQVHGPWRWPPQDSTAELRRERMAKMKRSIFATRLLGCKYWVVHPIMPYGVEEDSTENAQKTWELNIEFMSELLEYARSQNVTICLENMPMRRFSMATPTKVLEFIKVINDPYFKICLDTGHVAVFPDLSVSDSVRKLGTEIKVLHVHDNAGDRDAHMFPTKGIIDWKAFLDSLDEVGFDGVFSLETLPSAALDDKSFEAECIRLFNIAKSIIESSRL